MEAVPVPELEEQATLAGDPCGLEAELGELLAFLVGEHAPRVSAWGISCQLSVRLVWLR
jgi:hypothetical protein